MTFKPLILGAISISAVAALAGCGGSSSSTSPTPTTGGLTIPSLPGLPTLPGGLTGGGGSANPANMLPLTAVQTITGDPSVAAVGGACSAVICIYADPTSSTTSGGVVIAEPFPGGLGQAALEAAVAGALSSNGVSAGGTATPVPGLGDAAIKEIDANSATYAFSKGNYLVVISVTSDTVSGADMDSQVQAAAQSAAGQL